MASEFSMANAIELLQLAGSIAPAEAREVLGFMARHGEWLQQAQARGGGAIINATLWALRARACNA